MRIPRGLRPFVIVLLSAGLGPARICAQAPTAAPLDSALEIVQRYDLRRSINGKYAGLFYGRAQSFWRLGPPSADGSRSVGARSYLMEESLKDLEKSEKFLKAEMQSSFTLGLDWSISGLDGGPAPLARGFPALPGPDSGIGDGWEAPAIISVDPKGSGDWTAINVAVSYRLAGMTRYMDRDALDIRAQYALRYRAGQDPLGDPGLMSAEGKREAWIYVDALSRLPLFIREKASAETYKYADGSSVKNDGFALSFFSGTDKAGESREAKLKALEEKLEGDSGVKLKDGERGLALSLEDLRFVADSPELLPGEDARLAKIADALMALPAESSFLVVGHTANVGSAESQRALSLERAKRVCAVLTASGISAGRFILEGRGGTESLGDDATEEGRAINRRVEIILLGQ